MSNKSLDEIMLAKHYLLKLCFVTFKTESSCGEFLGDSVLTAFPFIFF